MAFGRATNILYLVNYYRVQLKITTQSI